MFSLYWTPIWYQLGSILPSKYPPKFIKKSWKYRPQEAPNNATIFAPFRHPKNLPLGTQLRTILVLQTVQETSQTLPKRPPDRTPRQRIYPRGPQEDPRAFRDPKNLPLGAQLGAIWTAQETLQTPPRSFQIELPGALKTAQDPNFLFLWYFYSIALEILFSTNKSNEIFRFSLLLLLHRFFYSQVLHRTWLVHTAYFLLTKVMKYSRFFSCCC